MVLDIYMLMCVESTALAPFLTSCGTESWFRSVAMVLKIPSLDEKQLEKISVILQKLSKLRYVSIFLLWLELSFPFNQLFMAPLM